MFKTSDNDSKWNVTKNGSTNGKANLKNKLRWATGIRNNKCNNTDELKKAGIVYVHYGSICWYLKGC